MTEVAIQQLAVDELVERLQAIATTLGGEFDINPPGDPSSFPALYLEEGDQDADDMTEPGTTRYSFRGTIEGYVQGGSGIVATRARSALYLQVVGALMGAPFNPSVELVREGSMRRATVVLADARRLAFALDFEMIIVGASEWPAASE